MSTDQNDNNNNNFKKPNRYKLQGYNVLYPACIFGYARFWLMFSWVALTNGLKSPNYVFNNSITVHKVWDVTHLFPYLDSNLIKVGFRAYYHNDSKRMEFYPMFMFPGRNHLPISLKRALAEAYAIKHDFYNSVESALYAYKKETFKKFKDYAKTNNLDAYSEKMLEECNDTIKKFANEPKEDNNNSSVK